MCHHLEVASFECLFDGVHPHVVDLIEKLCPFSGKVFFHQLFSFLYVILALAVANTVTSGKLAYVLAVRSTPKHQHVGGINALLHLGVVDWTTL